MKLLVSSVTSSLHLINFLNEHFFALNKIHLIVIVHNFYINVNYTWYMAFNLTWSALWKIYNKYSKNIHPLHKYTIPIMMIEKKITCVRRGYTWSTWNSNSIELRINRIYVEGRTTRRGRNEHSIWFYVVKHVKILFFSHCKVIIKHELTPHAHIYFSCTHLFHDNCTGERKKSYRS